MNDDLGNPISTLNQNGVVFGKTLRKGMADTKRVPGPTYYNPCLGMTDAKDVYSRTNLKSSVKYSFGRAVLPWQKNVKPTPGPRTEIRDTTERQVEGKYRSAPRCRIGTAARIGVKANDIPEDTPGPGSYWI